MPRFRASRVLPALSLLAAASLGACSKTDSAPTAFGVNVTVDATMVAPAERAKITTDKLTVVSDKAGTTPVVRVLADLPKALQGGTVHFHYTPGSDIKAGDKLTFGLDVLAGTTLIAAGSGGPVTLGTSAVAVTITLTGPGDGGVGGGDIVNPSGKGNGIACATDDECGTGFCTDGVCCNERCKDVCASCSAATKGVCTAYAADTNPETECAAKIPMAPTDTDGGAADAGDAGTGSTDASEGDALMINPPDGGIMTVPTACGGKCAGTARACKYPDATKSCGTAFCNTRRDVFSFACDGNGGCSPVVSSCTSYACDDSMGSCRAKCSDHSDCQVGFYCDGATHQCVDKKGLSLTCVTDDECKLGHCSSGVCCNTACNTAPLSCNSSGKVGQCVCPECTTGACQIFYPDVDGDGFGDRTATYAAHTAKAACMGTAPIGFVADNTDCDDKDPAAHPGQTMFFGFPSKGGRYDYDCDDKTTKETPEYPGAICKFCGAVGTCDQTSSTCANTSETASFQCPQEYSGGIIRAQSEPVTTPAPLGLPGVSSGEPIVSYAASVPGGAAVLPVLPPICKTCLLQCCGCSAGDKTGFRQVVACGDASVSQYTCGSCATAPGGAPSMTASYKQQRCR